jgi:hypothetical protein
MDLAEVFQAYDLPLLYQSLRKYESRFDTKMTAAVVAELQRRAGSRPVQTQELSNCGQLFEHQFRMDNTGRIATAYSGDVMGFLAPFMPPGNAVKITPLQVYRDEENERETQRIMRLGREAEARMNRPERTMASQDSGENSAPAAQGPEVDRAIEQHGKFLGIFDGKFF